MAKNAYGKSFNIENAETRFTHLDRADDKFGNPNHSVTLFIDEDLATKLRSKAEVVNGLKEDDASPTGYTLKVKSTKAVRKGMTKFPRVDADGNPTQESIWGGDVVTVRVTPCILALNGSMSIYMEGIKLIEKRTESGGGGNSDEAWGFGADVTPAAANEAASADLDDENFEL